MSRFRKLLRNVLFASVLSIAGVILGIINVILALMALRREISQLLRIYRGRMVDLTGAEVRIPLLLLLFSIFTLCICVYSIVHYWWRLRSIRKSIHKATDSFFLWPLVRGSNFRFRKGDIDVTVKLGPFHIGICLVTNEQYKSFIDSDSKKYKPPLHWEGNNYPPGKARHPVVGVSRKDAEFYCCWLSEMTGKSYRLPSEHEWEKAARGESGRDYPWEEQEFDPEKCNSAESGIDDTTPVDYYENGRSFYRCYDMVGNVSEWTSSTESDLAVIRGSSYKTGKEKSSCYYRILLDPDDISDFIGFRIVREAD